MKYISSGVTRASDCRQLLSAALKIWLVVVAAACGKGDKNDPPGPAPKVSAAFSFTIDDTTAYPVKVSFQNLSRHAGASSWIFGNGQTSTETAPTIVYPDNGTYTVRLVVSDGTQKDSADKSITIKIKDPVADFSYAAADILKPAVITFTNTSARAKTYMWDFGDGDTTSAVNPAHTYKADGKYLVKLTAKNPSAETVITRELAVTNTVTYKSFDGKEYHLFPWQGNKVVILSRNGQLDPAVMAKWVSTMDAVYTYYQACTGREPSPAKQLNGLSTLADVAATCGAGCGYLGATGIEMLNTNFDILYNGILLRNEFDQVPFYEFGRNFWFYGDQLAYKSNDPVTTGYAVLMRFLSLEAAGVKGAPFIGSTVMSFADFKAAVTNLVDQYTANNSLNWTNTLGAGTGVPGAFGGGTDLFASFCMRLKKDYGGETFIQQLWKEAGKRPVAATTQDAVDNFILAACAAANKNLTSLFTATWRWPMSEAAKKAAAQYP